MKGPTTNVDLSLYISLQALNDSLISWRMFLYLLLQVILGFTMKHTFEFIYKLPPFQ